MAKSKPCSLRGGWGSAGGSGLVGGRHQQAFCKGGEGGMGKEGGPSGDEGSGDGLAQGVWALAGSGFGELAAASWLQWPPASTPKRT